MQDTMNEWNIKVQQKHIGQKKLKSYGSWKYMLQTFGIFIKNQWRQNHGGEKGQQKGIVWKTWRLKKT